MSRKKKSALGRSTANAKRLQANRANNKNKKTRLIKYLNLDDL